MNDPAYANYWRRKQLLQARCPAFRVIHTTGRGLDADVLRIVMTTLSGKERILDVGAGSLEVRDSLVASGLKARYETLDVGEEYQHTYRSLDQAHGVFDAILLLDVLEHLPLQEGLKLLQELVTKLRKGGALIVQTPNGRCVRSPFTSDMTHLQSYNLPDLWAYVTCLSCDSTGYRVAFRPAPARSLPERVIELASRALVTRLLGLDYADNILLIAEKNS